MRDEGVQVFANQTIREVVGPDIDLRTSLSDVSKLVLAAGGNLETEQETPLDKAAIESVRSLFVLGGSPNHIIVLPHVGHFAVRLGGFESNLDGWGDQTLVIHRTAPDLVRVAAFFSDDRVELYWLPCKPEGQVQARRPNACVLVIDLLEGSTLHSGVGMEIADGTPSIFRYQINAITQ